MGPTFCCIDSDFGGLCWVGRVLCHSVSFPEWQTGESIPSFQTHMARIPGNMASTVQPKREGTLQQEVQEERGLGFERRPQNRCEIRQFYLRETERMPCLQLWSLPWNFLLSASLPPDKKLSWALWVHTTALCGPFKLLHPNCILFMDS